MATPDSPAPRLDAHQHFWAYDPAQYPWIKPGTPLQRDQYPPDLEKEQARVGMRGSIAVQARTIVEESRWLLTLADHSPLIRSVVGWVDLRDPNVARDLGELSTHKKFRGVREVLQDKADDYMLQSDFMRGIGELKHFGLTYDLLIFPRHLPASIKLVARHPKQPFVLDHIAKPPIQSGEISPWREQIRELAKAPNVMCKVSGMVTEADFTAWKPSDFRPYLDVVFEAFGPDRLMWGSDWPVCLLAGSYEQVFQLVDEYTRDLPESTRAKIFGGNAAKFYGVA